MTTKRKWRFSILIGAGLIAAAAVVYFSNGRVSTDKTQGTIGNRDVYRDGKVASADVAKPGTAPVATEAILNSSEFKELAKNPAFQELLRTDAFNELGRKSEFTEMLASVDFQKLAQDRQFLVLVKSETFSKLLDRGLSPEKLVAALREDSLYVSLADRKAFDALILQHESALKLVLEDKAFEHLLAFAPFRAVLENRSFQLLAARSDFLAALQEGTAARMIAESGRK
jgi:hypothetical protein